MWLRYDTSWNNLKQIVLLIIALHTMGKLPEEATNLALSLYAPLVRSSKLYAAVVLILTPPMKWSIGVETHFRYERPGFAYAGPQGITSPIFQVGSIAEKAPPISWEYP